MSETVIKWILIVGFAGLIIGGIAKWDHDRLEARFDAGKAEVQLAWDQDKIARTKLLQDERDRNATFQRLRDAREAERFARDQIEAGKAAARATELASVVAKVRNSGADCALPDDVRRVFNAPLGGESARDAGTSGAKASGVPQADQANTALMCSDVIAAGAKAQDETKQNHDNMREDQMQCIALWEHYEKKKYPFSTLAPWLLETGDGIVQ